MKKTTSNKLSKKLAQYGALSLAVTGMVDVNGQIIYTDVNPDVGGQNVDYQLDLNNDGTIDFIIYNNYDTSSFNDFLGIQPLNGNSVTGMKILSYSGTYYSYYVNALNQGAVISAANPSWQNYSYQYLNYYSCIGSNSQWCGVTDKFIGLRFDIAGNTHYGWARLDVAINQSNWVIKDYAYNSDLASGRGIMAEGASIMAGEGRPLSIDDNVFSKVKITSLNRSIALFNLPQHTNYKLFSLTGQSVLDGKIDTNIYVIEAKTLSAGIYIIELEDANSNAVIRKKVVL